MDIVSSTQYLVTVKIGTTVIGNSLNQSEQAILWSEICPNKSWLKNGKFRTALSAASGISDATLRRANDQNQSKMHNWSYSSTERSSAKELFDPKLELECGLLSHRIDLARLRRRASSKPLS